MTNRMGMVTCELTISADGYSAGLNQTEERPFGDDGGDGWGDKLHAWMADTPEENPAEVDQMTAAKAFIIGRNMFGPVRGEWDRQWNGWWGDDPPFHVPVFVLTHHARETLVMKGGTSFTFVTDGIEAAVTQARAVAGDKDVLAAGGGSLAQLCLAAGLLDELQIHVVPLFLGDGVRLFDHIDPTVELEATRVIESPTVTHLRYRVK